MQISTCKFSRKLIIYLVSMALIFSCKKENVTKENQNIDEAKSEGQVRTKKLSNNSRILDSTSLTGLTDLLNINELPDAIKKGFNLSYYHYYQNSPDNQLWVISLQNGTAGFNTANAVISLKAKQFSIMILSFTYNATAYNKNDFSTYTGSVSIYNQKLKKVKDLFYDKGILKKISNLSCTTC